MRALLLAAGYGTRLGRDIENDTTGKFAHLKGVPKPLLPIGSDPLLTRWVRVIASLPEKHRMSSIEVVTNALYHERFVAWAADAAKAVPNAPPIVLVCDGTTTNETRIGAVACLNLVVKERSVDEPLLVVAGDTLFFDDFKLDDMLQYHGRVHAETATPSSLIVAYQCGDDVSKRGIIEVEGAMQRVVSFLEKPQPEETESRLACPCFYSLAREHLPLLAAFLDERADRPLAERDAPGNFIRWLVSHGTVHAYTISGRFDVGNLQQYVECQEHFCK